MPCGSCSRDGTTERWHADWGSFVRSGRCLTKLGSHVVTSEMRCILLGARIRKGDQSDRRLAVTFEHIRRAGSPHKSAILPAKLRKRLAVVLFERPEEIIAARAWSLV